MSIFIIYTTREYFMHLISIVSGVFGTLQGHIHVYDGKRVSTLSKLKYCLTAVEIKPTMFAI